MVLDGPGRGHPEHLPSVRALETAAKLPVVEALPGGETCDNSGDTVLVTSTAACCTEPFANPNTLA